MKIINFYWKIYYTMPPSILENSQKISDKNLNIVDQVSQNKLLCVVSKPQYLSDIEKKQEEALLHLDEKTKTELKNTYLSQLQQVPFLNLAVFFKTKLLSGLTNFTPQEENWYGQLYFLAKLSSPEGGAISNDQIVRQIESVWDKSYLRYGNSRAVRNKNPWNLRMNGDLGKDKGGFAIFSTLEAGWTAFVTMVGNWQTGASKVYKPTYNLLQWAKKYDPWNPNYAKKLAQYLGIPITTQLKNIPVDALAKGIVHHEDGKCYKALKDKGII